LSEADSSSPVAVAAAQPCAPPEPVSEAALALASAELPAPPVEAPDVPQAQASVA